MIIEAPTMSTRRIGQAVGISQASAWTVLKKDLAKFPYKIQLAQRITPDIKVRRYNFAADVLELIDSGQLDVNKIIFSDEAHFWGDGYVNKQNYRICGSEKPTLVRETQLHPEKLTVWCGISAAGIIGPVFINQTIDKDVYEDILTDYLLPEVSDKGLIEQGFWFQQDGAPPHRTPENLKIIHDNFGPRVMAHQYPERFHEGMIWPAYSPDLSPLDFFLWGYTKDKVYKNQPKTMAQLQNNIEKTISEIPIETLQKVMRSCERRLRMLMTTDGGHIENIIG